MEIISRVLNWQGLGNEGDEEPYKAQLLLLILPDFLFQFPFLILFWVLIKSFYEGHLNVADDFEIPALTEKRLSNFILFGLLFVYFCSQAVLMILFIMNGEIIKFGALHKEISIFIICLCCIVLVLIFVMFIKTSGKPYRSSFYKK